MLWPWWALEEFSLGLSEIHALSESIPYISHSKMLPLDQPTRASQTTWLECVSDIQEERNQKGLIQFPCTIFFQKYIFTRARNQGTRFGLWIERSIFVIHLMPFAGKYYTLHLIQPQETLPVHSFIPCFAAENSQSGSEEQGSGEGFPRHRGSSAGLSTQLLRTACSFLTHTWLPASTSLDFRPHPPVLDSGPYSWCIRPREALGKTGYQAGRRLWTPLPTAPSTPALHPGRSGSSSISFLQFPTQTSFCRLCFLFRREFCSLTGR